MIDAGDDAGDDGAATSRCRLAVKVKVKRKSAKLSQAQAYLSQQGVSTVLLYYCIW